MALSRMLRVTVLAHREITDPLVEALQRAGVVDVVSDVNELPLHERIEDDPRLHALQERSAQVEFVREFLGRYHDYEAPFSTFVTEKVHLGEDEYHALQPDASFLALYEECEDIADGLASHERERERLLRLVADLQPWHELRLAIPQWRCTEHVSLFTGTLSASQGAAIRQRLREAVAEVSVQEMGPVGNRVAWLVMAYHDLEAEVRRVLAAEGFEEVSFPGLTDYPAEEIAKAEERLAEMAATDEVLRGRAGELAREYYHRMVALQQKTASEQDALEVRERFGTTEWTVAVSGWVPVKDRDRLEEALASFDADADWTLSEPGPDDDPPVELDNPWYVRPFEVLTDLYGRPRYGEIDPTPLLAPYFLIFFAICISDVGYGAMLIVGAWLIKHRVDVAPGVKKFMDLLMFGGAGAMVVGVLFGSYFALPVAVLPAPLRALQVLDPLAALTVFLIVTVVLGVVQVVFGVLVAAYDKARKGDVLSAVSDQLSTVFLLAMLGMTAASAAGALPGRPTTYLVLGIGAAIVLQGRALEVGRWGIEVAPWDRLAGMLWLFLLLAWVVVLAFNGPAVLGWVLLGATMLGLALSRSVRRSLVSVLTGLYAVYGMMGLIGDVLSYTRLAALGLSGALVGMVFNILAGLIMDPAVAMVRGGGTGILLGVLLGVAAAAVFALGHVFNVVINLLGAFVHPARLQFVEFFSKFYEAGGRKHAPFAYRTSQLVLEAGGAGREGGAGK